MIEYLIIAVSFAIMYHFRYTTEAIKIIYDVCEELELPVKPTFSPTIYSISMFFINTVTFPILLLITLTSTRWKMIERDADDVLKDTFGLDTGE